MNCVPWNDSTSDGRIYHCINKNIFNKYFARKQHKRLDDPYLY